MNDESRKSRTIKIRPSILRKAHGMAHEEGKFVGRWIEEAIEDKIERTKED